MTDPTAHTTTAPTAPRAVIYCRISLDVTGEALGVERQRQLCLALAKSKGATVVDTITDNDTSAYSTKKVRPGYQRLITLIEAGAADMVLAYHVDRLYRRLPDLERLVDACHPGNVPVYTHAAGHIDLTNASGRMVARILAVTAQAESERTGERIKAKHDELATAGKAPGSTAPYGYDRGGPNGYTINAYEAEMVRLMARRVLEGASLRAITAELEALKVPTRRGGRQWWHTTVRRVLLAPAIAGRRIHNRQDFGPAQWEPILDKATWNAVCAVLQDPARKRDRSPRAYPLTGLVFNDHGDRMAGNLNTGANGMDVRTYCAYASSGRPTRYTMVKADDLEALVYAYVMAANDAAVLPNVDPTPNVDKAVADLEAELEQMMTDRADGVIGRDEYIRFKVGIEKRLDVARKAAGPVRRKVATSLQSEVLSTPGVVRDKWPTLTDDQRRDIVEMFVERVVVGPARSRHTLAADRVTIVPRTTIPRAAAPAA